jgi:hypothetical protein
VVHGRRKILHFNVTPDPSAEWMVQQLLPKGRQDWMVGNVDCGTGNAQPGFAPFAYSFPATSTKSSEHCTVLDAK